jgi:hypothetical protein
MTIYWIGQNLPYYEIGQTLIFSLSTNDPLLVDAIIRVNVDSVIGSGNTQVGAVISILSVGPGSENQTLTNSLFDVTLEQEDAFFEFRFARFGYRYKYKNNEVSAYSPFTNPSFMPGEFDYRPRQGYNLGMVNRIRQLQISNFVPNDIPVDVVEVDILYKATNNNNVYVVDSFKPVDTEWTVDVNGLFEIKTEIITSVVASNQLLRPYDNVPRKALAQEVTANRLIYGNYTQNFNLLNSQQQPQQVDIAASVTSKLISTDLDSYNNPLGISMDGESVAQSVKSIRTYQVGVAYMDKYGRTTPVFTGKTAAVTIPKMQASQSNTISVKLASLAAPYYDQLTQFPYFKYYVKETSQEYYNLALDRFYNAEDDNLWLSFPSAERNKVAEGDFITLKKEHDSSTPVTEEARYKIIAIENEAPLELKETKLSMGKMNTEFGLAGFPIENSNEIVVLKNTVAGVPGFDEVFGDQARTTSGLIFRVRAGAKVSNYYKISTFSLIGEGDSDAALIRMQSAEVFGPDMMFTSTDPYGYAHKVAGLQLELASIDIQNKPEFTGRFFVKVYQDLLLESKIVKAGSSVDGTYARKALGFMYWVDEGGHDKDWWRYTWSSPDAQGNIGRLFFNYADGCGPKYDGKVVSGTGVMNIGWATGYGLGKAGGIKDTNPALLEQLNTSGVLFRFIDGGNGITDPNSTIYQVTNTIEQKNTTYDCNSSDWFDFGEYNNGSNQITNWQLTFKRADNLLGLDWNPIATGGIDQWNSSNPSNPNGYVGIEFIELGGDADAFTSENPAVFETEPKEATELDIYYEVPGAYSKEEHGTTHVLPWFNCYSFGNGVESDRIRDDYNQPTINNGVKASAVLDEPYKEETRYNGLIFSQIFNSTSGINGLNQFIQAESITKDVNPEYGSIQKLHSRDTNLVTLCENKSMKILANKDALFNADGSTNITSNRAVLGQTITFQGEYGIATNPESFAEFGFRMYYTDANRGGVIRLSNDGITEVSEYGMHAFFSDNLGLNKSIVGSWDMERKNYNVSLKTLTPYWQQTLGAGQFDRLNKDPLCDQFVNTKPTFTTTISFKEDIKGWTSRKTYIPESGAYLNNVYYTFKNGRIWEHNANPLYNTFYGVGPATAVVGSYYESSFNTIFNESPSTIKGFRTLNYSGTNSRNNVYQVASTGNLEYSLSQIRANGLLPTSVTTSKGWYTNSIITDLQEGQVTEFIDKEGKYFNYIKGLDTFFTDNCDNNVSTNEFNVQGIGRAISITAPPASEFIITNQLDPDCFNEVTQPILVDQSFSTQQNITGSFTIAESNVCSEDITFELVTDATTGGSLSLNINGHFLFVPDNNYVGSGGSFVVRVCCGSACSINATITISVVSPLSEPIEALYSASSPDDLCCVSGVTTTVWITQGGSFTTSQFYKESTLITRADPGWYSNNII